MTLNRLYNFSAGQVIQSQQINEELNQLTNSLNNNVLNANFSSNNIVSDGSIVSAISALDSSGLGGAISNNYSKGVILQKEGTSSIKLAASSSEKIVFSKGSSIYIEDSTKTLNVASVSNNTFVDIYIEEDTSDSPIVLGTLPIKLVGKSSGGSAYNTSPGAGQHLIGSVYIKNSVIIGTHSLETIDKANYHYAVWGNTDLFDYEISSTTASYSTKCCYVPVFIDSNIYFNVSTHLYSSTSGARWNFEVCIKRDSTTSYYISERIQAFSDGALMRTARNLSDVDVNLPSALYTYYFGGRQLTEDASRCNITIHRLYSNFFVQPIFNSFEGRL